MLEPKKEKNGSVEINAVYDMPQLNSEYLMTYQIDGTGKIDLTASFSKTDKNAEIPELARFGISIPMPQSMSISRFYGRGPVENYSDRKSGAFIGEYTLASSEQAHPYVRPQETGTKSDIRWWVQEDKGGRGIKIASGMPFYASATDYSIESLDNGDEKTQRHFNEVEKADFVSLLIDSEQAGVGGINSWGAKPLPPYRMKGEDRTLHFVISPIM